MTSSEPAGSPARQQQRGEPLVRKVLAATLEEIAEVGFERLSIEQVAARAGVNKTTIWRRWPTTEALAMGALMQASDTAEPSDTGSLRGDLVALLQRLREVCRSPAMRALLQLRFRAPIDSGLGRLLAERLEGTNEDWLVYFERARDRGELAPDLDLRLLRDLVLGSAQYLIATQPRLPSDETIEVLVDGFLFGVLRDRDQAAPASSKRGAGRAGR